MAPELVTTIPTSYNDRVDVWAIGILTYLILGHAYPFHHPKQQEQNVQILSHPISFDHEPFKNVSSPAKDFISLCLEKDKSVR